MIRGVGRVTADGPGRIAQARGQVHDFQAGRSGPASSGWAAISRSGSAGRPASSPARYDSSTRASAASSVDRAGVALDRSESFGAHGFSSSKPLNRCIARVHSTRTAPGERPRRTAISLNGMCSMLRRTKTAR